jgi:hypothetical protein
MQPVQLSYENFSPVQLSEARSRALRHVYATGAIFSFITDLVDEIKIHRSICPTDQRKIPLHHFLLLDSRFEKSDCTIF